MPQLGPAEILVVLVVALLVFGPKRLPEVGRQVGRGLKELRKIQETVRDEINDVLHHDSDDEAPSYATTATPAPLPAAGAGQHAPSRFRPAGTAAIGAAAADATDTTAAPPAPQWPPAAAGPRSEGASSAGAHAPSRFRAPGR